MTLLTRLRRATVELLDDSLEALLDAVKRPFGRRAECEQAVFAAARGL